MNVEKNIKITNNTELEDLLNTEIKKKLNLPPLIYLKVFIHQTPMLALYDPGSNVTILAYDMLKKLPITFKTISGEAKFIGVALVKLTIF